MRLAVAFAIALALQGCASPPPPQCWSVGTLRKIHHGNPAVIETTKGAFAVYGQPSGVFDAPVRMCRYNDGSAEIWQGGEGWYLR